MPDYVYGPRCMQLDRVELPLDDLTALLHLFFFICFIYYIYPSVPSTRLMTSSTTAAKSLTTAATLFAGPGQANNATPAVNGSATFHFVLDGTIQTLSTQNTPDAGPIKGLLFVPSLSPQDPCNNTTAPFIPANVTRLPDVERFGYQTIGLAPWVSPTCTESFLSASDDAGAGAVVFFVPGSNETKPPAQDDTTWLLSDGDAWKTRSPFPVYAIPGPAGATLMHQLASYSGNSSSLPLGEGNGTSEFLQGQPQPGDIRLFSLIDLDRGGKKMPSLWGFILAIVGTILVISIVLLLCYQLVQKRRRERLQRRIESGDADIENLGLHQMKVPQTVLDSIPVYTYPDTDDAPSDKHSTHAISTRSTDEIREPKEERVEGSPRITDSENSNPDTHADESSTTDSNTQNHVDRDEDGPEPESPDLVEKRSASEIQPDVSQLEGATATPTPVATTTNSTTNLTTTSLPDQIIHASSSSRHRKRLSRSQTTCAICLDDFVPGECTVRELPCSHIFHVGCIDMSLTQNSSLCPLCKKCVLPPGCWTVPVTNTMVHRDYMLRRSLQ